MRERPGEKSGLVHKPMSPLYYIVSFAIALVLIFSAGAVSETHRAASRYETASEQADTKLKRALEWMTFGIYEGAGDGLRRVALHIIRFIGKWSMTDVFVVAILLAFFSTESKSFTDASVGPGLYFFAGYGLLSLLGGQVLLGGSATGVNGAP